MATAKRVYTDDQRREILRKIDERVQGTSKAEVCRQLNVSPNMVNEWTKRFVKDPSPVTRPKASTTTADELTALREEVTLLRKALALAWGGAA